MRQDENENENENEDEDEDENEDIRRIEMIGQKSGRTVSFFG